MSLDNFQNSQEEISTRKLYKKPQVTQVRLVPEEAVLISGCKTSSTTSNAGPSGTGCFNRSCSASNGT
jgi:hypothetical protein